MTATATAPRKSILLHLPGSIGLPVPTAPGPVLTTLLTRFDSGSAVDLQIALVVEPRQEHVALVAALCSQVVPELGLLPSVSLVGPGEAAVLSASAHQVLFEPGGPSLSLRPSGEQVVGQARYVRDLVRAAGGPGRIRMLVLVQHLDSWGALEPIARAACADERVECALMPLEGPFSRTPDEVSSAVVAQGWPVVDPADVLGRLDDWDVVVLCDPYDEYRPVGLRACDFMESGVRVVLSPYAENIGGASEVRLQYDTPVHTLAWRIYAASDAQVDLYGEHCARGNGHVRSLGAPKSDWLTSSPLDVEEGAASLRRLLQTDRVVIWNPHFRCGPGGWSTFPVYAASLVASMSDLPDVGLIARPHPLLLPALDAAGGRAAAQARDFRDACAGRPNVHLDEDRDYRPSFSAATAMVSDLSSLIPEFLRLQRPVGYTSHPSVLDTSADSTWRDRVTALTDFEEVLDFIGRAPSSSGPQIAASAGVGARIVDDIVRAWALEAGGAR